MYNRFVSFGLLLFLSTTSLAGPVCNISNAGCQEAGACIRGLADRYRTCESGCLGKFAATFQSCISQNPQLSGWNVIPNGYFTCTTLGPNRSRLCFVSRADKSYDKCHDYVDSCETLQKGIIDPFKNASFLALSGSKYCEGLCEREEQANYLSCLSTVPHLLPKLSLGTLLGMAERPNQFMREITQETDDTDSCEVAEATNSAPAPTAAPSPTVTTPPIFRADDNVRF